MVLLWWALAVAVAFLGAASFYPALSLRPSHRVAVLVALATIVALAPWMISPEERIARYSAAFVSVVLLFKMWDVHIGAYHAPPPSLRRFLKFLPNFFSLVLRRQGLESQPTPRKNRTNFGRGLVTGLTALAVLFVLLSVDWSSVPFLLEHVLKASAFFVFMAASFDVAAALTRAAGEYTLDPSDRPLLARTPAEFWRLYNRYVGEFLREDVFRPMGGRRRPLMATLVAFAVSGIVHEYMFTVAHGRVQGYQLAFFSLQGVATVLTLRMKPSASLGVAGTFAFNALTSIFFFASFEGVVSFYDGGLPEWLWGP